MQKTKIQIHEKYRPLFEEKTRYYILTGGRGSGKSFAVSFYLTLKMLSQNNKILFTRYTLVSAKDSIIPEFKEKIELLNLSDNFDIQNQEIANKTSKSEIIFRGIKTSEGIQTAKLKSLTDVNIWVLDESEELTDEDVFNKIDLSIRTKKSKNIVILVLNPSYKTHWIYQRFFEPFGLPEQFNGTIENVTYIHTDYKDNLENISADVLTEIEKLKISNKKRYYEEILGYWKENPEGILFDKNKLKRYKKSDIINLQGQNIAHIDVADEGNDSLSFVNVMLIGKSLYLTDVIHSKEGEGVTRPKIINSCLTNKTQLCLVESNNQGLLFTKMLIETAKISNCNTKFSPYKQHTNKMARIIMQSDFILENVYFLNENEYEIGSYYDLFIRELTIFNQNGNNKNDDAPDSLSGLVFFLRVKNII